MAKLTVASTTDFSGQALLGIDEIDFINPAASLASATFSGTQLGLPRISPQVLVDGSAGLNAIFVNGTGLTVDLSGWRFANWDTIDTVQIRGTSLAETLNGSSQNDTILGLGGGDRISGGAGDDIIEGGTGLDRMDGGTGSDTLSYRASSAAVTIDLGTGRATGGDAFADSFVNFENVSGSAYGDSLTGNSAANVLSGEAGNDRLSGAGGADVLFGGDGRDTLTGGNGADSFVYTAVGQSPVGSNRDLITDFSQSQHDLIDLAAIDAINSSTADDSFTFIGTAAFTAAGQVRYLISNGQTIIQVNVDNNLAPDMEIALSGTRVMTAGDFIL
jgi:Ca2+-binding RTX toxin-like protein